MYASESLLTLDHSTLFYWTLSNPSAGDKRKRNDAINEWNAAVPNIKPTSGLRAARTSRGRSESAAPSRMSGAGRSSIPSVLTESVKIVNRSRTPALAEVKPEPTAEMCLHDEGGLSDYDEMRGDEREDAVASPIKGKN